MHGFDDLLGAVAFGLRGEVLHQQTAHEQDDRQKHEVVGEAADRVRAELEQLEKARHGQPDDGSHSGCERHPLGDAHEDHGHLP